MSAPAPPFRRILVGIDASPAELLGLFVEDEDVLRLAGLPFAGVVRVPSGVHEPLDRTRAEAELRALAGRARDALARVASTARLGFTFAVERGRVVATVLAASEGVDLLVLGAGGLRRSGRAGAGETALAAAERARSSVLLLPDGARFGEPVVAVDDGSPGAPRALAVARALAGGGGAAVVVAPPAATGGVPAALARLDPGLVVVAGGGRHGAGAGLEAILAEGRAALVVR